MMNETDLIGERFGRLVVIGRSDDYIDPRGRHFRKWHCICDCGNEKDVVESSLKHGKTLSCGCLQKERVSNVIHDLIGKKFGRLTVLELSQNKTKNRGHKWICRCECGTIKEVSQQALLDGKTLSCGCYNIEQLKNRNYVDLTGQKFGRWTVIKQENPPDDVKNKGGRWWLCECSCDLHTQKIIYQQTLKSGHSKSCGCLQREYAAQKNQFDLTGQIFDKLTVVSKASPPNTNKNKSATYWKCKCECGNTVIVPTASLNNGHTTSCGCIHSKGELKIIQILNNNSVFFIHNRAVFKDCKLSTGGVARFDFYVDNKYIIEYDGEQHYKYSKNGWNTIDEYEITKQRDLEKTQYCLQNNIPIIRIPYWIYNDLTIDDLMLETTKYLIQNNFLTIQN